MKMRNFLYKIKPLFNQSIIKINNDEYIYDPNEYTIYKNNSYYFSFSPTFDYIEQKKHATVELIEFVSLCESELRNKKIDNFLN